MITATAVGRLGRDAESRAAGQQMICSFSMAVDTGKKDDQGKRIAEWYSVDIWGKRGESLQAHLTKGSQVCVTGRMELQRYTKDGKEITKPVIVANDIALVGGAQQQAAPQPVAPPPPPKPFANDDLDNIFGNDTEIPF